MESEIQVHCSTFDRREVEADDDDESEHELNKEKEVQEILAMAFDDIDSASYEEEDHRTELQPSPINPQHPKHFLWEHPGAAVKLTSTPRYPNDYHAMTTAGPSPILDQGIGVIDSVNVNIKLPPTSQSGAMYYPEVGLAGDHAGIPAEGGYSLQVTVESQKAEIERLTALVSNLAQDHHKEVRLLKHQLHLAQEGRQNAELGLEQSRKVMEERESQTQELQTQVTTLKARISVHEQEKERLMDRLKNSETTLRHLEEQNIELCKGEVLRRQREHHEALEAGLKQHHQEEVINLRSQLEAARRTIEELKRDKEQLDQQVKQLEQRRLEKAELINRLNQLLEDSQNRAAAGTVSEEVTQLKDHLQRAVEREQQYQDKLREMKEKIDALQSEVTSFEGLRALMVDDLPSNDSMIQLGLRPSEKFASSNVGSGVSATKEEIKRLLSKLHQSKNKIINLEAEVRTLRDQLAHNSDRSANLLPNLVEAQTQVQNARVECEQFKSRAIHLETTLKETTRSWGEAKEQSSKLQEQLEKQKQELEAIKAKALEESRKQNLQLTQEALERQKYELEALFTKEKSRLETQISLLNKELDQMRAKNFEVKEQFIKVCEERTAFEREILSLKALVDGGHDTQVTQLREDWKKEKEAFMQRYQHKLQKLRATQEKEHQDALKEAEHRFKAQMAEVENKYKNWAQEQAKANQQHLVKQYQQVLGCLRDKVQQEQEKFVQEHEANLAELTARCQAQERELQQVKQQLASTKPKTLVSSVAAQTHLEILTKEEVEDIKRNIKESMEKLWLLLEGQMDSSSQRCQMYLRNVLMACQNKTTSVHASS